MDREKVIKGLDICANGNGCKDGIPNPLCPYSSEVGCDLNQILLDALELLKEQEKQKFFVDENGKITPLPVVVRCKECKYGEPWGVLIGCGITKGFGITHKPDWFCADGEKSD